MDAPDTLYLHVGLPKTATTYLQREVFPTLTRVRYLDTLGHTLFTGADDQGHGQGTLTSCFRRSAEVWGSHGGAVLRDLFGCERADRPPGDALVSDEGIGRTGSRPALLAAHLAALAGPARAWGFGRVRVLCVIRRQDRWLASHYAQVSDRNPRASQEDFEAYVRRTLDPSGERYGFGMLLDYAALGRHLRSAVGRENLRVLPYELLADDSAGFHARVAAFLGAPTASADGGHQRQNVRSTGEGVWALRPARRSRAVRLRPGRLLAALRLPDEVRLTRRVGAESVRLTEPLSAAVLRAYGPSNRAVAEDAGIDLAAYGYFP